MLPLRPALRFSPLAVALVAANLVYAEVPAGAPFTPEQQQLIRQLSASEVHAAVPTIASEAASSIAKTIEGEKQAIEVAKDALEVGRKSVDWWLSNISVWLGGLGLLIAVAGIGIPLWMGRKQKVEWQEKLNLLTQKLQEAETAQQHAEAAQQKAEKHASEIETLRDKAHEMIGQMPSLEQSTGGLSAEDLDKLRKGKPPHVVDLIERGWQAGREGQWETAKTLWELISYIESSNPGVWTNLGFVYVNLKNFEQASRCYTFSNALVSNAQSLSDLGNALGQWADSLPGSMRGQQDELFRQSRHLLEQSIDLSPRPTQLRDLCATLIAWARHSPASAAHLLAEAERLIPKLEKSDRDYTLACIRSVQGLMDEARTLLAETRAAGFLPDFAHLSTDKDLDSLRELDWFKQLLEEVRQQESKQAP